MALSKPTNGGTDYPTRIGLLFDAFNDAFTVYGGIAGMGVSPNVWSANIKGIQTLADGFFGGGQTYSTYVAQNWYYDGSDKFIANGWGLLFTQNKSTGDHAWLTSSASNAGGAGAALTYQLKMIITALGNIGVGTSTFGSSAAGVLAIANGTAPTTGPADTVQFYSSDDSAGNTVPSFYCEGSGVVATGQADSVSSVRVKMRINGTVCTFLCI